MEFVQKPYGLNIFPIPVATASKKPFEVSLGDGVISMLTVKKMYGTDAVIFRLQNNTSDAVETYVQVNGERLPLAFGKYEVKTVVYENDRLTESYELLV